MKMAALVQLPEASVFVRPFRPGGASLKLTEGVS